MSSTNKTTHYDLSQYTANDKPTYLVDYNSDMSAIDTGIYNAKSEAETNTTAIGTLANLNTTEKTNLVGAINEVNTQVGTNTGNIGTLQTSVAANTGNIGTMANLDTTDKTSLVNAINEVDELIKKFNLVNFDTYDNNDMSFNGGSFVEAGLSTAFNSDYSIGKIYGYIQFNVTAYATIITVNNVIPSGYRPSSDITINALGTVLNSTNSNLHLTYSDVTFKTDGSVIITIASGTNSGQARITIHPCLLFLKDFGDTPVNP